jgi:hypothetical protein
MRKRIVTRTILISKTGLALAHSSPRRDRSRRRAIAFVRHQGLSNQQVMIGRWVPVIEVGNPLVGASDRSGEPVRWARNHGKYRREHSEACAVRLRTVTTYPAFRPWVASGGFEWAFERATVCGVRSSGDPVRSGGTADRRTRTLCARPVGPGATNPAPASRQDEEFRCEAVFVRGSWEAETRSRSHRNCGPGKSARY